MYFTYKWLHLLGLMMFFSGISATTLVGYFGKMKEKPKILMLTRTFYVLGMLVLIVSGFLTLSAMGAMAGGLPLWAKLKLGIVVLFIPCIILANMRGTWARFLIPTYVLLGAAAAALALFKPL